MSTIFKSPVIGIDLGASFTKVSYRPGWDKGRRYDREAKLAVIDRSVLIPSIAIFVARSQEWLCGKKAADYKATPADQVFENWKAALFSKKLDPQIDGSLDAAGHFFSWLAQELAGAGIPVKKARVKLCLPAFNDVEGPASILAQRMARNGWANLSLSRIEEPRANTVGVFSQGQNVLWQSEPHLDPNPIFIEMFAASVLLNVPREHILARGDRCVTCAIIDVGSFTTDISIIEIDSLHDGDCIRKADQKSFVLGMKQQFEAPVFTSLFHAKGFENPPLSFSEKELMKRELALGGSYSIPLPQKRTISITSKEYTLAAESASRSLADNAMKAFDGMCSGKSVKYVILTGGGVSVPAVKEEIEVRVKSRGILIVDLQGVLEPRGEPSKTVTWQTSGETLERVATAIGAASVISDLPVTEKSPEVMFPPNPPSDFVLCSCRGGNNQCMRCGGAGHYRVSESRMP